MSPTPEDWDEKQLLYVCVGQGISLWARMESDLIRLAARLISTPIHKAGLIFYSINNF